MRDIRAYLGAALVKFFKLGRLSVGGQGSGIANIFGSDDVEKHYWKAYEQNVWAYRAISVIAQHIGQLPIKVVSVASDGAKPEEITGHPFEELVDNPNPFMSRQDIVELLLIFAESVGDAYWLFDDGTGAGRPAGQKLKLAQVREIWPIESQHMTPIADAQSFISGYKYRPGRSGKSEVLSTEEIFAVRYPSPASILASQGAIKPITWDLASDISAQKFERQIMKNLAANIVFLKTDSSFQDDQREIFRREIAKALNNIKVGFMEAGLDFASPQIAAKDLPFLEMDKRRQRRIMAAFGVPPLYAGSEDAKYDNAEQQKAVFWEGTLLPKLSRIESMLTKKLHALGEDKRLRVVFDTTGVSALQGNLTAKADTAGKWRLMGVPLNDLIKIYGPHGMEDVEGGDVGLVSAGLIPLEDVIDPDPIEPEGTPEDAPAPSADEEEMEEEDEVEEEEVDAERGIKTLAAERALDDAHWRRFIVTQEPGFRRLRAAMRAFFKAQEKAILARIRQHVPETPLTTPGSASIRQPSIELIVLDTNEETGKLSKKAAAIIKAIYTKLGKQAVEDVGVDIDFNIESPEAAKFLSSHVPTFARAVNETTKKRVSAIIQQKFATGATQRELTDAIQKEFKFAKKFRAARIARTESGIAGNAGIQSGMEQAGVEEKRWITSRDAKVRNTHISAGGQTVNIRDSFLVGGIFLKHPGDPDGTPEEIINCRCVARAVRV